ncbi:MAG: hypothetical protein JWQ73_1575 [Variovorax sp.]|nr:hypothetical protein [Variovorax sp.]
MSTMVEVGDLRVACTITGNGPPLLLLHGAEGSHRMFDQIAPHLAAWFTVIAYDQRDCGGTENPDAPSTLQDLAADAKGLLHALGHARAHVYGTSFGGRVAQCLALCHPKVVERLVLGSTWPLPLALDTLNPEGVAQIQALRAQLPDSAEKLVSYFLPEAFLETHPQFLNIFKDARPATARGVRRAQTVADTPALDLRALTQPTLLIAGTLDRVVPPEVTLGMSELIVDTRSLRLEGVGHAGVAQVPEEIATHVGRFLRQPTLEAVSP